MKKLFLVIAFFLFVGTAHGQSVVQSYVLTWTDNSNNEEGFYIYRMGTRTNQVGANVTTFTDTVAGTGGQQFCWTVSAFNHANADGTGALQESAQSNSACANLPFPPNPPPNAPNSLTVVQQTTGGTAATTTSAAKQPAPAAPGIKK